MKLYDTKITVNRKTFIEISKTLKMKNNCLKFSMLHSSRLVAKAAYVYYVEA